MAGSRRDFMRILGTSAVILAAGGVGLTQCDPMPADAISAWGGPDASVTDPRKRAIAYALLAPNPHNRQPWIVDLSEPDVATFYCDNTRLLPETDPPSRQITIGCGAFLEILRMAAAEQGYALQTTLFPSGAWPEGKIGSEPLARIAFVEAKASVARDPLFAHVLKRQTNRGVYGDQPLTPAQADQISAAVDHPAIKFGWTSDTAKVSALHDVATAAWRVEITVDRTYLESVRLMRITAAEISEHRDGLSFHGPFFWWMNKTGLFTRDNALEDFNRSQAMSISDAAIGSTRSFIWLTTENNDRAAQIAAGRAYVRAALKASALGLAQQPLSQALQEFPEMAGPYAEIKTKLGVPSASTVQMFYRIGTAAPGEFAPRRRLDDLIKA